MTDQHPLKQIITAGDLKDIPDLVNEWLAAGETAGDIVEKRVVPGMAELRERFIRNKNFVPEMLIAAEP